MSYSGSGWNLYMNGKLIGSASWSPTEYWYDVWIKRLRARKDE